MYNAWGNVYLQSPPPKQSFPKKNVDKEGKKSFFARKRKTDSKTANQEQGDSLLSQTTSSETIAVERLAKQLDDQKQGESLLQTPTMVDASNAIKAQSHCDIQDDKYSQRLQSDSMMKDKVKHKGSARDFNKHRHNRQQLGSLRHSGVVDDEVGFDVNWTEQDVKRMAREIANETIAEVHMSLFGYWIRAKPANYELAKVYIRELALDQGYNVDRISNGHLRRLLMDTYQARPVEPPYAASLHRKISSLTNRSPSTGSDVALRALPTTKTAALPYGLRARRNRAQALDVEEAKKFSQSKFPPWAYPPNTPDRPAPLSLKPRVSQASNINSNVAYPRSFSSPIYHSHSDEAPPLPGFETYPRHSHLFQEAFSHPLLTPTRNPSRRAKGKDQIADRDRKGSPTNELATVAQATTPRHDPGRRYASTGQDGYPVTGTYEFDDYNARSDSEATCTGATDLNDATSNSGDVAESCLDETFDELESYFGSGDEHSILETSSSIYSQDDRQVVYTFASFADEPAPDPDREDPVTVDDHAQLHRPLPLRDYGSEAHLLLKSRAKGGPHHGRHNSAGSLLLGSRPTSHAMETPTSETRSATRPLYHLSPQEVYKVSGYFQAQTAHSNADKFKASGHTEEGAVYDQEGHTDKADDAGTVKDTSSQTSSNTTGGVSDFDFDAALSEFPASPTQSSATTLPSHINLAPRPPNSFSWRRAPTAPPSQPPPPLPSSVSAQQQTARRDIDPSVLLIFERTWRDVNEALIARIYGRKDVQLGEADIKYIESIARQLRENGVSLNDLA